MNRSDSASDRDKEAAAEAAALLVAPGMTVGLGTGSTVAFLIPALVARAVPLRCVATSPATAMIAAAAGLSVEPLGNIDRIDIAIDGADQIAPDGWLIKGGGGAHTREKLVAAAADRFVVIADATKAVPALTAPIPLELLPWGLSATIRGLRHVRLRKVPLSPDNGVIADYTGELADPADTATTLSTLPGVVEHGLFPPRMVTDIVIASDGHATHQQPPRNIDRQPPEHGANKNVVDHS